MENWQSVINPEVIGRIVSVLIVTNRKMALYHYHHHFVIDNGVASFFTFLHCVFSNVSSNCVGEGDVLY